MPAKLLLFIVGFAAVILLCFESNSSREAYYDCVQAGVQSNDTCSFYTNYKPTEERE